MSTFDRLSRVGGEIPAGDYWQSRSAQYNAGITGQYHAHRLEVVTRLLSGTGGPGARCVDLGCGDGMLLEYLSSGGADVVGLDVVPSMVEAAVDRLQAAGLRGRGEVGGVPELGGLPDGSVDLLLAVNVLAYFHDEEAAEFYRQAARIVRPGWALVVTHSNELFDLYTLNRYTVEFHARHFTGWDAANAVSSLLRHPDRPDRVEFNVRTNPLTYGRILRRQRFEERSQEFINLHPLPPLLMDPHLFDDIDSREYASTLGWPEEERWKLLFQCSMFGSRAERV